MYPIMYHTTLPFAQVLPSCKFTRFDFELQLNSLSLRQKGKRPRQGWGRDVAGLGQGFGKVGAWLGPFTFLPSLHTSKIIFVKTKFLNFQAAYMIANPLSYNRSGFRARLVISLSTLLTLLLLLPIHVLYFYWLQPEKLKIILVEEWGWPKDYAEKVWNEHFGKSPFTLVRRYQTCERFYIPRSLDYRIKRYFTLSVSLAAVSLVLASYGLIFATILKSRKTFGHKERETADKLKTRAQNAKIVKAAIIMTSLTLLPWLPNIVLTVLFEADLQENIESLIGKEALFGIVDATNYLFYTVPWVFPLLNLLTNPVISKSLASFRERKKEGTVLNRTLNTAVTSRSALSNTRLSNKATVYMAVFASRVSSQNVETRQTSAHPTGVEGGGGEGGEGGEGRGNGMTPVVVITNDHAV
ncbi:hypothetical protein ACHWQZ_G011711 [Mnemiopsis leidyi]